MKFATPILSSLALAQGAAGLSYTTGNSDNTVKDLIFKNRAYVPYGPDLTTDPIQDSSEVWDGYGYAMAAAEHIAYDPKEGYLYIQGEAGSYITIMDYYQFPPSVTSYSLDLSSYDADIKDVKVCPEKQLLFLSAQDPANKVLMFRTVDRSSPGVPKLLAEIDAGPLPDVLLPNSDCSVLAVTNENEGNALNEGAVHLVSNFEENGQPTVRKVVFSGFTDDYLLGRNVHMPLTEKAMEYWDEVSNARDDIDFAAVRAAYNPGIFLEPEFLAFTDDDSQLYVNLQENSALLRIDVATAEARSVDGYGLKAWTPNAGNEGIDLVKDDSCSTFVQNDALYSVRAPDGMALVTIDGESYVLTADEGDDKDFGQYEEKREAGELFVGGEITERSFTSPVAFFDPSNSSAGASRHFNSLCEDNGIEWCASGAEISVGSSAVNYNDPLNPVMDKIVLFGGRGMSIFKVPSNFDDEMEFVWDSGSEFEKKGCESFPWAHNGIQDEGFAPKNGAFYELNPDEQGDLDEANDPFLDGCEDAGNGQPGACPMSTTIDEKSPEDGPAPESVTLGIACTRLVAVACGENNSNCFLYDISNIQSPELIKVFNLSPESETKSPGVAYDERVLGEHDPESTLFVNAEDSPTGKAGIIFAGAISGTVSFYEFECTTPVEAVERPSLAELEGDTSEEPLDDDDDGLSAGAIAGIAVGSLVVVGLIVYIVALKGQEPEKVVIDSSKTNTENDGAAQSA